MIIHGLKDRISVAVGWSTAETYGYNGSVCNAV